MFESYVTYEVGIVEPADFPPTDSSVWILGRQYSAKYDLDELRADVRSKIWLTYRRNFPAIGGSGPTSDCGWGCCLRVGQMVTAEALVRHHLGRNWQWDPRRPDPTFNRILKMFEDKKNAIYSIHQIAQMGVSEGKEVGQWFGPNTVAQVLRKLSLYDEWSSMVLFVAMDNTVIVDEIKLQCLSRRASSTKMDSDEDRLRSCHHQSNGFQTDKDLGTTASKGNVRDTATCGASTAWSPLLLFVPLRLGLSDINPIYVPGLKKCFTFKQSLGLIGGRPNHACYFIGYVGDQLVYLDPHTTQPTVCLDCSNPDCSREAAEETYHCPFASRMDFLQLDPSVALCFYCGTEEEFDDLCERVHRTISDEESTPLFEICKERKWLGMEAAATGMTCSVGGHSNGEFFVIDSQRIFDGSDDEYELL